MRQQEESPQNNHGVKATGSEGGGGEVHFHLFISCLTGRGSGWWIFGWLFCFFVFMAVFLFVFVCFLFALLLLFFCCFFLFVFFWGGGPFFCFYGGGGKGEQKKDIQHIVHKPTVLLSYLLLEAYISSLSLIMIIQ